MFSPGTATAAAAAASEAQAGAPDLILIMSFECIGTPFFCPQEKQKEIVLWLVIR